MHLQYSIQCKESDGNVDGNKSILNFISCIYTINVLCTARYITPCSKSDPLLNICAVKRGQEAIASLVQGM